MRQTTTDVVEDVQRVTGVMGYIKAVCAALGSVGVGVLIAFYAPPDLKEEIPVHWEVGIGFMIVGGLFSLALFCDSGPGSIGQRCKSLLLGLIAAAFAVGCAISQLGPYGVVGYGLAFFVGLFSLFSLWEVITGRPDVTGDRAGS